MSEKKKNILEIKDLKVHFPLTKGIGKTVIGTVKAVDGVSFVVTKGTTV